MKLILGVVASILIAGCASTTSKEQSSDHHKITVGTIEVPVEVTPDVPNELTAPCLVPMPKDMSVSEAVRVATARRSSLDDCNRRLRKIRNMTQGDDE